MNRKLFAAALLIGSVVRAAALPLPGTRDVGVFKSWTYNAALHSPARLYGIGGSPPEHRVLAFHGAETTVDYPPVTLYELATIGRVYRTLRPSFPDDAWLTSAIKLLLLIFEVALLVLVFIVVRTHVGVGAARWAVVAYWLNPAPIFDSSILGYLDPLFVLPLAAAVVAAAGGMAFAAGLLFAVAIATKAQAIVVAPAVALGLWNTGPADQRVRRFALAAVGGAVAITAVLAPLASAGSLPNLAAALESLTRHDMLSANAPNLWWIVGYLLRARYSLDMGVWAAFTAPAKILAISRTIEIGYPNPRIIGTLLTLAAFAWCMWTARTVRDRFLVAGAAGFFVHAYATLAAQVHENHLFAAIPFLIVASSARPRLRPLMWTLSVIFGVNLNLFYGVSEYIEGWTVPRAVTIVDLSVVLAAINCAALVWHARLFSSECRFAAGSRQVAVPV